MQVSPDMPGVASAEPASRIAALHLMLPRHVLLVLGVSSAGSLHQVMRSVSGPKIRTEIGCDRV